MKTIFDLLNEKEKTLTRTFTLQKDEILFHEGDECFSIGIVKKGVISISSYSYQGVEMNYNTILEGGIFGNNLLFSSDPFYKGNVISKTLSEVVLIDKVALLNILQNNPLFLKEYLSIQSNFSKALNNKIKILSFNKARDRFLYYLSSHNNDVKYRSITSLAVELNLSREVLSRLISSLKKEGIISLHHNHIILLNP